MEIILIVAVVALAGWWIFFRKDAVGSSAPVAPYKVETPPVNNKTGDVVESVVVKTETVNTQITDAVTQTAPVPVQEEVKPVVEAPAKKPRKPRAAKAEKPVAKKAAKPKKAAAMTAKTKSKSKKA